MVFIIDPTTVIITTSERITNDTILYPQTNSASVRVFSLNVTLHTDAQENGRNLTVQKLALTQ